MFILQSWSSPAVMLLFTAGCLVLSYPVIVALFDRSDDAAAGRGARHREPGIPSFYRRDYPRVGKPLPSFYAPEESTPENNFDEILAEIDDFSGRKPYPKDHPTAAIDLSVIR